jgi:hypothetical protein
MFTLETMQKSRQAWKNLAALGCDGFVPAHRRRTTRNRVVDNDNIYPTNIIIRFRFLPSTKFLGAEGRWHMI